MDTSEKQIIELEGHVKEFWRQRKSREKIANKLRNMEEREWCQYSESRTSEGEEKLAERRMFEELMMVSYSELRKQRLQIGRTNKIPRRKNKKNLHLDGGGCSVAQSCLTLWLSWTAAHQASLSITNSQSLLKLMSIELVTTSNHLILACPFSSCLQSFPASGSFPISQLFTSVFSIQPKYWSFIFSIGSSSEYSGLISFRIVLFDLAVQGTVKSLLQCRSLKASILQCSAFFIVQLSHPYMTTGKTIPLTTQTCWQSVVSTFYCAA